VATLGSLFVGLDGALGMRDALVLTTLLMAAISAISAVICVLTARLPDPRHTAT
jgi:hypothetical protein